MNLSGINQSAEKYVKLDSFSIPLWQFEGVRVVRWRCKNAGGLWCTHSFSTKTRHPPHTRRTFENRSVLFSQAVKGGSICGLNDQLIQSVREDWYWWNFIRSPNWEREAISIFELEAAGVGGPLQLNLHLLESARNENCAGGAKRRKQANVVQVTSICSSAVFGTDAQTVQISQDIEHVCLSC